MTAHAPLERLLGLLAHEGSHTTDSLARQLHIPRELLEMMLQHLERACYVRVVSAACSLACGGCAQARCCAQSGVRLWQITPAGRRAACS